MIILSIGRLIVLERYWQFVTLVCVPTGDGWEQKNVGISYEKKREPIYFSI